MQTLKVTASSQIMLGTPAPSKPPQNGGSMRLVLAIALNATHLLIVIVIVFVFISFSMCAGTRCSLPNGIEGD